MNLVDLQLGLLFEHSQIIHNGDNPEALMNSLRSSFRGAGYNAGDFPVLHTGIQDRVNRAGYLGILEILRGVPCPETDHQCR